MTKLHELKATPETVFWGNFNKNIEPVLTVDSGDVIAIETITHQSGDAPKILMDEMIEKIWEAFPQEERGPGDHIMTGPIHVRGAEPGDVLEVRVLNLEPRLPYGSQVLANWGYLAEEFDQKEYVTIYRADVETGWVEPQFTYEYPGEITDPGQVRKIDEVDQNQWSNRLKVPLRMHFGVSGVAPAEEGDFDTTPPYDFGGNIDNRNFVKGTSMYYKVNQEGAQYYAGDSHFAQGDGELSGTAVEGSLNGLIQLIVHKNFEMKDKPLLETPNYWMTHGLGEQLNDAMREAATEMIHFLTTHKGMTRVEAYSLLSVAGDFHVSQVANGVKGIHCRIDKRMFESKSEEE